MKRIIAITGLLMICGFYVIMNAQPLPPTSLDETKIVGYTLTPVEMTSLSAACKQNSAVVSWSTASEVNCYGFEVERRSVKSSSLSVNSWNKIGFVAGNGTSNTEHTYSYSDASVSSGTYAYRLKQIDNDGTYKYSSETEVTIDVTTCYMLNQNYPNPFNPTTIISYYLPVASNVMLKVYNIIGEEVATLVNEMKEAGSYTTQFNASRFASGVYFFRLTTDRFSSVKKMMLMK